MIRYGLVKAMTFFNEPQRRRERREREEMLNLILLIYIKSLSIFDFSVNSASSAVRFLLLKILLAIILCRAFIVLLHRKILFVNLRQ